MVEMTCLAEPDPYVMLRIRGSVEMGRLPGKNFPNSRKRFQNFTVREGI
jgi:hypothetical protein